MDKNAKICANCRFQSCPISGRCLYCLDCFRSDGIFTEFEEENFQNEKGDLN